MSELSSLPHSVLSQRLPHTVMSVEDVAAIERRVRRMQSDPGSADLIIDFEFGPSGLIFGVVPVRAFPVEWPTWPLMANAGGVGVCFPVEGAGHLGVAVNTDGEASWFSIVDGELRPDAPPACRLLDDVCRTRLSLLSAPPERSPEWYWLGQWLAAVVDASNPARTRSEQRTMDVLSVAASHPAIDLAELHGLDMSGLAGFVVERHRDHVRIADWDCIHLDARSDASHPFHEHAEVLDLGAFSRWVDATSPPLSDLAAELTTVCSPLGLRLLGAVISDMVVRQSVAP